MREKEMAREFRKIIETKEKEEKKDKKGIRLIGVHTRCA